MYIWVYYHIYEKKEEKKVTPHPHLQLILIGDFINTSVTSMTKLYSTIY